MKKFLLVFCILSTVVHAENCIDIETLDCEGLPIVCKDKNSRLVNGVVCSKYPNGKIAAIVPLKNGKMNGTQKTYYENGKIEAEATLKDGLMDGVSKTYDLNGKIVSEEHWKNNIRLSN